MLRAISVHFKQGFEVSKKAIKHNRRGLNKKKKKASHLILALKSKVPFTDLSLRLVAGIVTKIKLPKFSGGVGALKAFPLCAKEEGWLVSKK